ncbi:MAG TPA: exopolyphosphatase [Planctomycetota bacterium]|nr:exopolyphosphatase [Planctomycetota bacterium]
MRLITRGDFDGLVCAVLLKHVETISSIVLMHPRDAQDQRIACTDDDIVANLPFIRGCGMWFDHHASQQASRAEFSRASSLKGAFALLPSCAEVIRDYYMAQRKSDFSRFNAMIEAAAHLDSGNLLIDDILFPRGWILLGLTLDPRSNLGSGFEDYFRLLTDLVPDTCVEKVLEHPEVVLRADRLLSEQLAFRELVLKHASQQKNVILTDFRGVPYKPAGNRFLVYALFPDSNVEVRVFDGRNGRVVIAVGRSITNRTCTANIGQYLTQFGGGGHTGAGAVQVAAEAADKIVAEIVAWLQTQPLK